MANGKWIQFVAENKLKYKSVDQITESKASRKEERRKKATIGKTGGGNQGRETKTKSTKKKYLQGKMQENKSDEDEMKTVGKTEITIISTEDIKMEIMKDENVSVIEELVDELAYQLQPKVNKFAIILAEQFAQSNKTTNLNEIEDCLNVLIINIRIFDKGIKQLDKADQLPLTKYLLKSLGLEFVGNIFKLAAQQNMLQIAENLTTEARQKLLPELPIDVKESLAALHNAVMGDSVEDFLNTVDGAMGACCIVLKKYDKKKEKPQISAHKEALLKELHATQDPALALHLTTSVLFTAVTQHALHISGRHVSSVLAFLQERFNTDVISTLFEYHGMQSII